MLTLRKGKSTARSRAKAAEGMGHAAVDLLPIELWILILRAAQYDDLLPRYRWLRSYSLVCRAWSPHAQQLLFAHVSLRGSTHCAAFMAAIASARALSPAHAAALCSAVRTMSMVMDHQPIYAHTLALVPHLRELHVCMYHAAFRPPALAALARLPPTVRALRVRAHHPTALFQLLALFPHIEFLEVDASGIRAPLPAPPPCAPPPWRLRELRYANVHRGAHAFVEWALSGPGAGARATLEALRVQCPTFSAGALPALGLARLRTLAVPRVMAGDELGVLAHVEEVWMIAPRYPSPAFRPLPAGLRHLALHPLGEAEYSAIVADLAAYYESSEGRLEVLTYHRRVDEDDDEGVEDVQLLCEFCRERGVEFRLMDPPYGYYAGERVPFEPVSECPRAMPLSARRRGGEAKLEAIMQMTRKKPTLRRKIARSAKKAFGSAIHPAALARP
ncbi:hypothetical protein C2E23DRAFT_762331 [Lenzites betulinus]|nr:hypothetical protein C2E23DRAFT_762331 [Lenzites betulinus]